MVTNKLKLSFHFAGSLKRRSPAALKAPQYNKAVVSDTFRSRSKILLIFLVTNLIVS